MFIKGLQKLILPSRFNNVGGAVAKGFWCAEGRDQNGKLLFRDEWENIVVNTGLDYLLDVGLSDAVADGTHYILLTDGTPTVAAGDTMASHVGWTEVTAYSEGVRQTWTEAGVSGQSITNTASQATFTINAASTVIGGAGLTNNSTKGGATGTLYAAGAFSGGDRTLNSSETIDITATMTASSS